MVHVNVNKKVFTVFENETVLLPSQTKQGSLLHIYINNLSIFGLWEAIGLFYIAERILITEQ